MHVLLIVASTLQYTVRPPQCCTCTARKCSTAELQKRVWWSCAPQQLLCRSSTANPTSPGRLAPPVQEQTSVTAIISSAMTRHNHLRCCIYENHKPGPKLSPLPWNVLICHLSTRQLPYFSIQTSCVFLHAVVKLYLASTTPQRRCRSGAQPCQS